MKHQFLITTAVICSALSSQVIAEEKIQVPSTQEVVSTCKTPSSPESRSYCVGYVTAIYDTYLVTRHPRTAKPFICVKQPAPTRDQVILELVNWSDKHPEYAAEPASKNVLRFFSERFPCGKSTLNKEKS